LFPTFFRRLKEGKVVSTELFSGKPDPDRNPVAERQEKGAEIPLFEVYRNLVENSLDAMLLTDPAGAGRVLAANPEACRMLGWSEEELVGSPRSVVFNMDDPRTSRMMEERQKAGRFRGTTTFRRKDGATFPADVSTILFEDSAGQTRAVLNIHDVSERKRMEEELEEARRELEARVAQRTAELREAYEKLQRENAERRKAEEMLYRREQEIKALVENAPDLIMRLDRDLRFTYLNRAVLRVSGKPHDEFLGKTDREMGMPEELASFLEGAYRKAFETGQEQSIEFRTSSAKGLPVFIWSRIAPELDRDGKVATLLIIARDITERIEAEEERRRLAAAVDQAAEGIIVSDSRGVILYANPSESAMTGFSREELVGTSGDEVWRGSPDAALVPVIKKTVSSGRPWSGRVRRQRKDGSLYLSEVTISPIRDTRGTTTNYIGLGRDITKEARIEEQLRQAQKLEAVGTLAGGIAHDFNNILAAIIGNTEIALDETPVTGPRRNLEQIIKASLRARDLVRQILTFSTRTEQKMTALHLAPLIEETFEMLKVSLPSTISVHLDLAADPDTVCADPPQVQQILMNLSTNAAQAMDRGGRLDVVLGRTEFGSKDLLPESDMSPGEYLVLSVKDTGCGMDAATAKRVFEPFFTTRGHGRGTGLGLSVVYGIVKGHGGGASVSSAPGEGSEFRIYLPAAAVEVTEEEDGATALQGGSESILFVDDEPDLARLGEALLSRLGYDVVAKTSSRDALKTFMNDPSKFSLLVTDQIMPEMTGSVLAQHVLRIRPDMPVILITGHSETMSREHAKEIGISEFVMKPVSKQELAGVVRRVLERAGR
jgi:PAS domain S-box-containing protein